MEICFYMPEKYVPDPETAGLWAQDRPVKLHQSGKIAAAQSWVWQTWVRLAQAGFRFPLAHSVPNSGVVIALGGFFGERHRPPPHVFFVAIAADWKPHPLADWHILQNGRQHQVVARSTYIPNWTQPGLIARDSCRGDRVAVASFYGDPVNLAPEMKTHCFRNTLAQIGLKFEIRGADRWHDYSDVDISIGIRAFSRSRFHHKPPTKLFNAWLAGVPFIGGMDSAYDYERKTHLDYLQAVSLAQLLECLRKLRSNSALWQDMRENGLRRAGAVNHCAITSRWQTFLTGELPAIHAQWSREAPARRAARLLRQRLRLALTERLIRFIP